MPCISPTHARLCARRSTIPRVHTGYLPPSSRGAAAERRCAPLSMRPAHVLVPRPPGPLGGVPSSALPALCPPRLLRNSRFPPAVVVGLPGQQESLVLVLIRRERSLIPADRRQQQQPQLLLSADSALTASAPLQPFQREVARSVCRASLFSRRKSSCSKRGFLEYFQNFLYNLKNFNV